MHNCNIDSTDSCTSVVKCTNATMSLCPVSISLIVFAEFNPNEWFLLVSNFHKEVCCLEHRFLFCNWPFLKVFILYVSDLWIVCNDLIKHLEWTLLCFCVYSIYSRPIWILLIWYYVCMHSMITYQTDFVLFWMTYLLKRIFNRPRYDD